MYKATEENKSMQQMVKEFLIEKKAQGLSQKTITNYQQTLDYYMRTAKDETINKEILNDWINMLRENGISMNSINHYIRDIRAFAYWAMSLKMVPNFVIKQISGQEPKLKYYSDPELNRLLVAPSKSASFVEWRTYTIINTILATGLRADTILNLRTECINGEYLCIDHQKNKHTQYLPITPSLSLVLSRYINMFCIEGYLFPNINGEKMTYSGLRVSFAKYTKSRGVEQTNIHGLRHSFARKAVKNGMNAFVLKEWMGHSDVSVTQKYVRLFGDDLKDSIELNPLETMKKRRIERRK